MHVGPHARQQAASAGAVAFAHGNDIVLGAGAPSLDTQDGRAVLAHEVAHVVQQRIGGTRTADGDTSAEADAQHAAGAAVSGARASVSVGTNVGVARLKQGERPAVVMAKLVEFTDESGQRKQVTEAEFADLRKVAEVRVRRSLQRVKDNAENHRSTHEWFMKDVHGQAESFSDIVSNPSALIGIAVDMRAGVTPPFIGIWGWPVRHALAGLEALAAGDLARAGRLLALADSVYRDAVDEWNTYMGTVQDGSKKLISELGVVRDASFALALSAAVILAAPVVAAGAGAAVTGAGITGTAATGLTLAGSAVGTGLVGAGAGTVLRGGTEALAQGVNNGKINMDAVKDEAWKGAKEGFTTGVTAGFAPGLGKAVSLGAKGSPFIQQLGRRMLVEGTTNSLGSMTSAALEGKSIGEVAKEGAIGFGTGVVTAPLGAVGAQIAGSGRPLLAKGLEAGGSAAVGYGMAKAGGATDEEALQKATVAGVTSLALSSAEHDEPPPTKAPTKAPAKAPVQPEVQHGPLTEADAAFADLRQGLADVPVGKGPLRGGRTEVEEKPAPMGPEPAPPAKMSAANKAAQDVRLRGEDATLVTARLDKEFPPSTPARTAIDADPHLRTMAADSPTMVGGYWGDFQAKNAGPSPAKGTFGEYVKARSQGEARGRAGEQNQAFERAGKGELIVVAPEGPTEPGFDLVSYEPKGDRVKLIDDKSHAKNVGEVSALEWNLPKNIRDAVEQVHKQSQQPGAPPELKTNVLPKLASAARQIETYVKKNPHVDLTSKAAQKDFATILDSLKIDRVVTNTAGAPKIGITKGLADRGFKKE